MRSFPVAHPTHFPDVNVLLGKLLSGAQTVLGGNFVGLYLYGSLATGDFDLEKSDVDFVVVTADEISDKAVSALETMHRDIAHSGLKLARKLEGSYIPRAEIRRHTMSLIQYPTINEEKFYLSPLGSDWVIQRHVLREQAVIVAGPPTHTLIDPVSPDDLRQAVLGFLNEWWAPMLDNPARLQTGEYQAYAILTMCRVLFTLQNGTIASKVLSAQWVQRNCGEPWIALIAEALLPRRDTKLDRLGETQGFIQFTLELAKQNSLNE